MKKILISTLSLILFSCAGSPPKLERPVKLYNGAPEVNGICRLTKPAIARIAKKALKTDDAKSQVNAVVKEMFAPDEVECIRADDRKFSNYGCYSFSDIAVMLRWQENLLYSCDRWKQ